MLKLLLCLSSFISFSTFAHVYPDPGRQRRDLTPLEKQHLLHLGKLGQGGCSASALTPNLIITAERCMELNADGRYSLELEKGYFELDPTQTFTVVTSSNANGKIKSPKFLEVSSHYSNDIMILKIKWDKGNAPTKLKYPHALANQESALKFGSDLEATKVFAIGYPKDLDRRASYSAGFLKDKRMIHLDYPDPYTHKPIQDSIYLKVNASLTSGNSGGPVYVGNFQLLGIVDAGDYGDNQGHYGMSPPEADPAFGSQNPKYWNLVGAIYRVYPQMKTLQLLFPNGVNPQVTEEGDWVERDPISIP